MLDSVGLSIFNDDQGQALSFVVTAAKQTPKQKSTSQENAQKLLPKAHLPAGSQHHQRMKSLSFLGPAASGSAARIPKAGNPNFGGNRGSREWCTIKQKEFGALPLHKRV